ncbi:hypothetical protein KCM76_15425 [Zooshikella marina]|uniref:hypothetical protein n=1 Tax=Zooshikella ganghwensis TaxID=202772 RepID=UPI001BAF5DB6|nr:hypothetical protein [Zooshikella ganghwensis]MBU2707382.1 hypothetical protein [Zooshikella ganghwensis]
MLKKILLLAGITFFCNAIFAAENVYTYDKCLAVDVTDRCPLKVHTLLLPKDVYIDSISINAHDRIGDRTKGVINVFLGDDLILNEGVFHRGSVHYARIGNIFGDNISERILTIRAAVDDIMVSKVTITYFTP